MCYTVCPLDYKVLQRWPTVSQETLAHSWGLLCILHQSRAIRSIVTVASMIGKQALTCRQPVLLQVLAAFKHPIPSCFVEPVQEWPGGKSGSNAVHLQAA